MAGRGPAPKPESRTRHKPVRGEWKAAPGIGWQHGPIPGPPSDITKRSAEVWEVWFRAWWASHWTPDYLPQIKVAIQLYDLCQLAFADPIYVTGEGRPVARPNPVTELRQAMDGIGVTFKGQQDRRWAAPKADETPAVAKPKGSPYEHLRSVA